MAEFKIPIPTCNPLPLGSRDSTSSLRSDRTAEEAGRSQSIIRSVSLCNAYIHVSFHCPYVLHEKNVLIEEHHSVTSGIVCYSHTGTRPAGEGRLMDRALEAIYKSINYGQSNRDR